MSSEVIVLPKIAIALSGMGAALAPAAAGLGLAYGALKIANKLRSDYEAALRELNQRNAESEMAVKLWALQHDRMTSVAQANAELVTADGAGGAMNFVHASLREILRLAKSNGFEDLDARAQELAEKAKSEQNPEELAKEAVKLTADLHLAINKMAASGKIAPDLEKMFGAAKAEIEMLESADERAPLVAQLEKLEALQSEESRVALQGIANLRERTGKLLYTQIAAEQKRARRREVASQTVAMLQALSKVADAPEANQAVAMLEKLNATFAADTSPSISTLEGFLKKAQALFESCEARLSAAASSAYVADSVAETLMEMGYDVSAVPEEGATACMVSLDQGTGMMVSFDQSGQMIAEMVAFDEESREPDLESQERVCSLVDEIFEELKKKDIQIKEKKRKTMKHGKLKLVEKPAAKIGATATKPKERALS